jgi:hypothetical protein
VSFDFPDDPILPPLLDLREEDYEIGWSPLSLVHSISCRQCGSFWPEDHIGDCTVGMREQAGLLGGGEA